ncbi:MAG: hypothetical protein J1E43_10305, partial [Christensenellaceae bacterium]|nr:hypothetical protein [Christensenellaceae bacterium]
MMLIRRFFPLAMLPHQKKPASFSGNERSLSKPPWVVSEGPQALRLSLKNGRHARQSLCFSAQKASLQAF